MERGQTYWTKPASRGLVPLTDLPHVNDTYYHTINQSHGGEREKCARKYTVGNCVDVMRYETHIMKMFQRQHWGNNIEGTSVDVVKRIKAFPERLDTYHTELNYCESKDFVKWEQWINVKCCSFEEMEKLGKYILRFMIRTNRYICHSPVTIFVFCLSL